MRKTYAYTAQERRAIIRGTSWHNPKYLNFTKAQFKAECGRTRELLKKALAH